MIDIKDEERLTPVDFAIIKEYLQVGGNYKAISELVGIPKAQVMEIDHSPKYREYQQIQDKRITEKLLNE